MKIREFLNKANKVMTYTQEQLGELYLDELSRCARLLTGWRLEKHPDELMAKHGIEVFYKPDGTYIYANDFKPATNDMQAIELQSIALKHNSNEYINHLGDVVGVSPICCDYDDMQGMFYSSDAVKLILEATPRQRTIAAILTLQGQGGTGE